MFVLLVILKQKSPGESTRGALMLAAGFLALSAVLIIWITANGAFKDWWLQSFVHAARWNSRYGGSMQKVLESIVGAAVSAGGVWYRIPTGIVSPVWTIMPFVCCAVSIALVIVPIVKRQYTLSQKSLVLLGMTLVSIASWTQYHPIICERHLYWAAAPMTGIFAYAVYWLVSRFRRGASHRVGIAIATLVLLSAFFSYDIRLRCRIGLSRAIQPHEVVKAPCFLKGMLESPAKAAAFRELSEYVDATQSKSPGIGMVTKINPYYGALYLCFVLHRPLEDSGIRTLFLNWSGYDNLKVYPGRAQEVERFIRAKRPVIVCDKKGLAVPPGYSSGKCLDQFGVCLLVPDNP